MSVKVERIDHREISEDAIVRRMDMGNIVSVQYMSNKNNKQPIQMLGNRKYIDLRTGEICECQEKAEKRIDHINSLRRTFHSLRNIINANVTNPERCQWITLTYAENMQDTEKLYHDFEKFHKRYRYYIQKNFGIEKIEYIAVPEPQGRGAWHIHLLYIFQNMENTPYVPNEVLRRIWSHGFVKITSLKNVDNVGAYLTAYLSDMHVDELIGSSNDNDKKVAEIENKTDKRVLKGMRLWCYPADMKIFRCSRRIKRPVVKDTTYAEAMADLSAEMKTYEKTIKVTDKDNHFETVITTEFYNKTK